MVAAPFSQHPADTGTSSVSHLEENIAAEKIALTPEQLKKME